MAEGYQETTRIVQVPGKKPEIYIERKTMSGEEVKKAMKEHETMLREMQSGPEGLIKGIEKLFGDIDPGLKEILGNEKGLGRDR